MIGVINRLLFDFLDTRWGREVSDQVKARAGVPVDTQYHMDKYYEEADWQHLFKSAIDVTGTDAETFEWDFGQYCGAGLPGQFAGFMMGVDNTRDMLIRQPRIHNTISMSLGNPEHRARVNSKFTLEQHADRTIMHYASSNRMCTFYRSLATYMGHYFGDHIEVTEHQCMKNGNDACEIHVIYHGKKSQDTAS